MNTTTPAPRPSYRHVGKGPHGLGNVYHGCLRDGSRITWECGHRHGTRGEAEACAEAQLGPVVVPVWGTGPQDGPAVEW